MDEKKEKEWNSIMKFHLMRKFIVHANISEKNYQNLLKGAEINDEIWFNSKTKDFSISIEYVKEFSKSISAVLSEIDHQIFLYNHCRDAFEIAPRDWLESYLLLADWCTKNPECTLDLVAGNHDVSLKGSKVSSFETLATVT